MSLPDFDINTNTLYIVAVLLFLAVIKIIQAICSSTKNKGVAGEKEVALALKKLPSAEYMVLNDLMFKNGGKTVQIDHVIVSVHGIFVLETKAYTGIISGGEFSQAWTQNIYGNKYELLNPILQNNGHVNCLKHMLSDYGGLLLVPVVVFAGDAQLNVACNSSVVVYLRDLLPAIKRYYEVAIEPDTVSAIVHTLLENNITDRKIRKQHTQYARESIKRGRLSKYCPLCGSPLVERKGEFGSFIGCSNYPKCKYTRKVNG